MHHFQDTWSHASEFSNIVDVIIPPDTLLPCQMPSNKATFNPETALILAVYRAALSRLANSYMRPHHKALVERGEILSWVYGDGGKISLEVVCEALSRHEERDIEPEILRAAIVAWCRDMERGKFRNVVVRQSPVRGEASNQVVALRSRKSNYIRKADRRRASLEVRA